MSGGGKTRFLVLGGFGDFMIEDQESEIIKSVATRHSRRSGSGVEKPRSGGDSGSPLQWHCRGGRWGVDFPDFSDFSKNRKILFFVGRVRVECVECVFYSDRRV